MSDIIRVQALKNEASGAKAMHIILAAYFLRTLAHREP